MGLDWKCFALYTCIELRIPNILLAFVFLVCEEEEGPIFLRGRRLKAN